MDLKDFFTLKDFSRNVKIIVAYGMVRNNRYWSFTLLLFIPVAAPIFLIAKNAFENDISKYSEGLTVLLGLLFLIFHFVIFFIAKMWHNKYKHYISQVKHRVIPVATNYYLAIYYALTLPVFYLLMNKA